MRIKIEVEFEVTSDEEGLTEDEARDAAEMAVFHNLAFTNNGEDVTDQVTQHVDGFGECEISIPTD